MNQCNITFYSHSNTKIKVWCKQTTKCHLQKVSKGLFPFPNLPLHFLLFLSFLFQSNFKTNPSSYWTGCIFVCLLTQYKAAERQVSEWAYTHSHKHFLMNWPKLKSKLLHSLIFYYLFSFKLNFAKEKVRWRRAGGKKIAGGWLLALVEWEG